MADFAARSESTDEIQLTVRLTPEGVAEARQRLADLEKAMRSQTQGSLRDLLDRVQRGSQYASEEEVRADVDEALDERWRNREREQRA